MNTLFREPNLVLWWIPVGYIPTLDDAVVKIQHLHEHGASPEAFTFKQFFGPTETETESLLSNNSETKDNTKIQS